MRITIISQIDEESREQWGFNLFDLTAVFVYWCKETKPKRKRTWIIKEKWDKYSDRNEQIEPELPENIKAQAFNKIAKLIKIKTWSEWKSS